MGAIYDGRKIIRQFYGAEMVQISLHRTLFWMQKRKGRIRHSRHSKSSFNGLFLFFFEFLTQPVETLDAVVFGRIVAGAEHDSPGFGSLLREPGDGGRRNHAEKDGVEAPKALKEGLGHGFRARAGIPSQDEARNAL